jgi:hypothetical protein
MVRLAVAVADVKWTLGQVPFRHELPWRRRCGIFLELRHGKEKMILYTYRR